MSWYIDWYHRRTSRTVSSEGADNGFSVTRTAVLSNVEMGDAGEYVCRVREQLTGGRGTEEEVVASCEVVIQVIGEMVGQWNPIFKQVT